MLCCPFFGVVAQVGFSYQTLAEAIGACMLLTWTASGSASETELNSTQSAEFEH